MEPLPPEDPIEAMPVVVIHQKTGTEKRTEKKIRPVSSTRIKAADPVIDDTPTKIESGPTHALSELIAPEPVTPAPVAPPTPAPPLLRPEVWPYLHACTGGRDERDECTEYRIKRHIERTIEIPFSVKGTVATTVTFEIDAQGSIGRIHMAPKVPAEVEQEITRVLRKLPVFVPGSQDGHPVAVYYQIPLVLRRN